MNRQEPRTIKQFTTVTNDKSSIKKFINGNHLTERAKSIILSSIDNDKNYLYGFFIFIDDNYYYCIKPPYEFYKFDTFDELVSYIVDKYKKYKYNLSTFDSSKETQERILVRINDFFTKRIGDFVSYDNYLRGDRYNFSTGITPSFGWLPNFHSFKIRFYKNTKMGKYEVMGDQVSPFSFKGYDFAFVYDKYEPKLYLRYVATDEEGHRYDNHQVYTDGTMQELIEFFYDQYPDIVNSLDYIYDFSR
jgi:hypothetical protein